MNKRVLITALILFRLTCYSLDPNVHVTQYMTDHWELEQGLPQNSIKCSLQSTEGYLWFGTGEGLVKFNGTNFKPILKDFSINREINTLAESTKYGVLFGTNKSGVRAIKNNRVYEPEWNKHLLSQSVNCITVCKETIWIGSSGGLNKIENGIVHAVWSHNDNQDLNGSVIVQAIYSDSTGKVWAGLDGGKLLYIEGSKKTLLSLSENTREVIFSICPFNSNTIMIGTEYSGIYFLNGESFTKIPKLKSLDQSFVSSIVRDRHNNIWIGTTNGLYRWNDTSFEQLNSENNFPGNTINNILEDNEGSLWIGTNGYGLIRLKEGSVTCFSKQEGLRGDIVFPIMEDSKKRLWVGGYDSGLNLIENNKVTRHYTIKDGLSDIHIRTLFEDSQKNIWVGAHKGITILNGDGEVIKTILDNREIHVMYEDSNHRIWIGTTLGLVYVENGRVFDKRKYTDWGLKASMVTDILEIEPGKLWIATLLGGIHILEKDIVTSRYTQENGLNEIKVYTIKKTSDNHIWACTYDGIYLFKNNHFYGVTTTNGLFEKKCYTLLEDDLGFYWISGNEGIYRINSKQLLKAAETNSSVEVTRFGTRDGMRSRECNGVFQPSGYKASNSSLMFPTLKGIAIINPSKSVKNTVKPPVFIEQVFADGSNIEFLKYEEFKPGTGNFEFSYASLSYMYPEFNQFKYKLEGQDTYWHDAGNRHTAFYNYLPPGKYTFKVIASNNDGLWNLDGDQYSFNIKPYFYQYLWFRVLAFVIGAVLANILYRWIKSTWLSFLRWRKMQQIGHFRIIEKIGSGGMGDVFKAVNRHSGDTVALKQLHSELQNQEDKTRFEREIDILKNINHPNVVSVYESGEASGKLFYSMDLIEGCSLKTLMVKPISWKVSLVICDVLLDILNDLHNQHIIHRDIKPTNIMIKNCFEFSESLFINSDFLKSKLILLDFGIAKMDSMSTLTQTGTLPGTLAYQPPEIFNNGKNITPAYDFYSLATMVYEMISGKLPFDGEDTMTMLFEKMSKEPIPLNTLYPSIPFEISDVLMWMLDKNLDSRLCDYRNIKSEISKLF